MKGERRFQPAEVRESQQGGGLVFSPDKTMVFTAGYSGDGMPSSQVEMDMDGIMGETEKGVEEVTEDESTEVKAAKTQLGEVVASATLKISRACLKHIDPKLRPQRSRKCRMPYLKLQSNNGQYD